MPQTKPTKFLSAMSENNPFTCPFICPGTAVKKEARLTLEAGSLRHKESHGAAAYVPGHILPPEPKVYQAGAPPRYLPQPGETSGDVLNMGPMGPWAPGHLDWNPISGMTGVRPVVDKYSITRYSTGDWRRNNAKTLDPRGVHQATAVKDSARNAMKNCFDRINNATENSNKNLSKRIKDLSSWKKKVRKALNDITEEIELLDKDRARLKGASRILMLPECISKECLELRTHRYEPDLVRDDAEQELIKEMSLIGEIRRIFTITLNKVEVQMQNNKAAKAAIEGDWSDKRISLKLDKENSALTPASTIVQNHPGVARWPENATSLEYWEHYCSESIRNCEEVRNKSKELRADLMTVIVKGGQDMKNQADRSSAALAETVSVTKELTKKLEEALKDNLARIADTENFIDELKDTIRQIDEKDKLVMTRLHSRNYTRPNVENCRDEAQYALMKEAKHIKDGLGDLKDKLRDAEGVRATLMKYRGDLEKDIASKRKALLIDGDRLVRARAFFPSPAEFAGEEPN